MDLVLGEGSIPPEAMPTGKHDVHNVDRVSLGGLCSSSYFLVKLSSLIEGFAAYHTL